MITGAHFLLYSSDPAADRAFFRDNLGLPAVDAGSGLLIFGLPPAELGVHPPQRRLSSGTPITTSWAQCFI
jgi:hypothetical protein